MGKRVKVKKVYSGFDFTVLVAVILLIAFGLVMLYSASSYDSQSEYGNSAKFLMAQVKSIIFAAVLFVIALVIDYHVWYKLKYAWFFLAVGSVFSAVIRPASKNGATRAVDLGFTTFSVVELAKTFMIMFCAVMLCNLAKILNEKGIPKQKVLISLALYAGYVGFVALLVLKVNNNMSTAIIILFVAYVIAFVVLRKYRWMYIAIPIVIVGYISLMKYGESHTLDKDDYGVINEMREESDEGQFRFDRIIVWQNPEKYSTGKGYQTVHALYAIGSGGLFGKGLGNGTEKIFIPEVQNDMIFSVVCEELGIFGGMCIVLLFLVLLYRMLKIAIDAPDLFGSLIVVGVMSHIAIQVLLHIAVNTNFMMNTGVTLPFVSYGGSALMMTMVEMGVVLNVSKSIQYEVE